jgi:hypothetical protein
MAGQIKYLLLIFKTLHGTSVNKPGVRIMTANFKLSLLPIDRKKATKML